MTRKRRSVAADSVGEERGPAKAQGVTPVRAGVIVALAIVVIALIWIAFFSGNGTYTYKVVLQNASQLVTDNEVLIGGHPVGSVESLDLTEDNLAEIEISVEQQLHEGSTATARATSLSGVANHYLAIDPGPNSNPALEDGATLDLGDTLTPVDLNQFINTFPRSVRRGLSEFIRGQGAVFENRGVEANRTYKFFAPALNRTKAFIGELASDQRLFERFIVGSSKITTAIASRSKELESGFANANTTFNAIAAENEAFSETLQLLPQVFRQANTTFVNLRAALDDLDPLVETAKPATKDLAPFLRELTPVLQRAVPTFRNLRLTTNRPGFANDQAELLGFMPAVYQRGSKAFPHSRQALADSQPFFNFARAYTPDIFNGFGKLGQVAGYYDANGHYARVQMAGQNIFSFNEATGVLDPIPPSQQYDFWGSGAGVRKPCPGGAAQAAPDGSAPFTEPPNAGSGISPTSDCDPADAPPGP